MPRSNRDRVGEVMDTLKAGLGPYVLREYKRVHKARGYLKEIERALTTNAHAPDIAIDDSSDAGVLRALSEAIDTHGWLNLVLRNFDSIFREKLGHTGRSYISELLEHRNAWAHQRPFSIEDAYRAADTATRLLEAIGAPTEAQKAKAIGQDLLRLRFEAEQQTSRRQTGPLEQTPQTTAPGLKPWRLVVKPHPDVATGRYLQAEFAADLAQVVQGKAEPEYGDPAEFFRRTYLTEGLVDLLVTGVLRLTGQGGDPVVQLQTSFGGGKTHSMLALYHLMGGKIGFSEIPGGEDIVARVGKIDDRIEARCAVIVGTAFSPTEPRVYPDATTHTVWGDMAYQIGGAEGYQMLERADLAGVSPGSDTLLALLEKFGPALIIIDELVAFARNLYGATERLPAGSFDAVMTFVQSLTEAVRRSSDSMLLVSIPASDIEIGGEGGKRALEILANTIGRIESVWKPVTATESFEIVRRRLFSSEMDYAARDATLAAFREMYASSPAEFPSRAAESDYQARMKAAYPIHPELFDRLYEDWSTLERFQRTRGVLRLMSAVIHQLWQVNDQSLMIMPGSVPLYAAPVRNEMLRYLPENWSAIIDADVDGEGSKPFQIDGTIPTLGQYTASRRVARGVFVGSAPSVAGQSVRGVEEVRVHLATVQPGEQIVVFNDALRRMSNQLTYLYSDGSRYWYDTRPTVNRLAQDRAQNMNPDVIFQEALDRLREVAFRRDDFAAVHIAPRGSEDVDDKQSVRVVVLDPRYVHRKGNGESDAQKAAKDILENRGSGARQYRNMLVFIAADAGDAEAWEKSLRDYLAWQSIYDEAETLNLDAQQMRQVGASLKRTDETAKARLQETYSWLIVPSQPEPTGPIEYQAHKIAGQESFYDRAARKLHGSDWLISKWSPDNLRIELDQWLWHDADHVSLKQLWLYFASYCYLPRLSNQDVLIEAVRAGVQREDAPFGYATMYDEAERAYRGGVFCGRLGTIYLDGRDVIVHPEIAEPFKLGDKPEKEIIDPPPPPPPPLGLKTRYHGSVSLDPQRLNREFPDVVKEVIEHLTGLVGTDVTITVEISARRPIGFDDGTIRTVSENSRTLKFDSHGFEE